MLSRKWLSEGYYIEDEYGELTKTEDSKLATHYHDGYSLGKITKKEDEKWKSDLDDISMFSHWKDDSDDDISMFSHWKD